MKLLESNNANNITNETNHDNTNGSISYSACGKKIFIPQLTYKYIDNRKACCYCKKHYIEYSKINDFRDDKASQEVQYLTEDLYLHFEKLKADEGHKKSDLTDLDHFIEIQYKHYNDEGIMGIATFSFLRYRIVNTVLALIELDKTIGEISGEPKMEIGSKTRKLDMYSLNGKFCSTECKDNCQYSSNCNCD